ncbi:extracellular solute-binding protein [Natrarchaeobius oligotrophus]|uniref:Extracellular solute-binding protein n=1 Tax=Natrarchaeobius chitinivorans TaxID=1679083 RepID=A0A3N6MM14_NATCH|nr:extracellular solute-binding protein [Natrarchaeobius chitinivorans]RQH02565.1 extracellular solute-binding protein [Natrarchaeobius chitinivorans]
MTEDSPTNLTRRQYAKLSAALTAGAVGTAGCLGDDDDGSGGEGGAESISLLTWNLEFLEDSIEGWIDDFQNTEPPVEADYSDTDVEWVDRMDDQILSYYQSQLQTDDPVTVFDTLGMSFTRFAEEGIFVDLEEYASSDFMSKFGDESLEYATFDGDLVRMPFYQNAGATYINTELFEEAGIDEYPYSVDEFFDTAERIVDESDADYGLTTLTFDYRIWPFFWAEGIDVLNESDDAAAFNTSRAAEILERFHELTEDGVIPEVTWTGFVEEQAQQFGAGDTGMFIAPLSNVRRVQGYGDWIDEETLELTLPPGNRGNYEANGLCITEPNTSEAEREAAWDLIRSILSDKWQEDFLRNTTVMAGNLDVQEELSNDEEFRENNPLLAMAYDLWPELEEGYVMAPSVPEASEIADILDSEVSNAALGEKEPEDALDDAEDRVNDALSG